MNITSYGLAFIEGFALILSPCILPILPIILSGSLTGGKRRPIGIIIGFTLFFAVFSLLSGLLIRHLGIDLDLIRKISYVLIILFGIVLISDRLSNVFSQLTQKIADKGLMITHEQQNGGLWSGILFGALVSLIWVPCGGPILAAAIIHLAVQKTFLQSFISFLFFALGSVLPMILIALAGKSILRKTGFLKSHAHLLRKTFGVIIIIFAIITGFIGSSATIIKPGIPKKDIPTNHKLIEEIKNPDKAPDLNSQGPWLNSPPLNFSDLRGKVVLIDFWTYSCINCIRTLPYLRDWYNKYHEQGLVIIGVHAPEFEFEKKLENVKKAVKEYNIAYPVVLDNDYHIWQSFNNAYWPAHYLIDKNGNIVYKHFGEGNDAETEHNIQVLLGFSGKMHAEKPKLPNFSQTPETYLGFARADNYRGKPALSTKKTTYQFPDFLSINEWALQGQWQILPEKIQSLSKDAAIKIHFSAKNVYAVMGSINHKPIKVTISLDHQKTRDDLIVTDHKLYTLIDGASISDKTLTLQFNQAGIEIYTFTFG